MVGLALPLPMVMVLLVTKSTRDTVKMESMKSMTLQHYKLEVSY